MDDSQDPGWKPHKLSAVDLRTPMTAAVRRLPAKHRDDLHARRVARDEHFTPGSDTWRIHVVRRTINAGLIFVFVTWLFTPVSLFAYLLVPFAFVYGAVLAWLRPRRIVCGVWAVLMGSLLMTLTGTSVVSYFGLLGAFCYFMFGMITELSDRLAASDGE